MGFIFEALARQHDRAAFDCGEPALNEFLRRHARQNQERNVSRTYVATRPEDLRVVGFYTLSSGAVGFERLPERVRRRLPHYPVPVVHLGRLASDLSVRGEGLGELLLFDAFRRAAAAADIVGVFAMEVVAKHDKARDFYVRYGFEAFEDNHLNLYLPMETIRRLL
ncbi:MAG TPA: GNAT family N-acetyltransferase [Longimicrobium sp.]